MYFYRLSNEIYSNWEESESVIISSEKKYSYEHFENMVISVMYPKEGDEDYVDEYTFRNIYEIADILVEEFGFDYIPIDVDYIV